ncbi:MAG: LysM peptidoglycan-binding domain-containing protein [Anaerolineae bacterium]|nr:LysM peptidoglycan-binding domain-containing protein [Anaerolineae bacterium]
MRPLGALLILFAAACTLTTQPPETPTLTPTETPSVTATPVVIDARNTPEPTPAAGDNIRPGCTPRSDWPLFTVPPGMNLSTLAFFGNTTIDALAEANCLINVDALFAGQDLRVPPGFPPTAPPEFGSPVTRSRVGLSPYVQFTDGWYEVQPGATVSLGWEPALPAEVTTIEFYATSAAANAQPVLIAVDSTGGDNLWISWTVPAQFAGQISAVAYRGEAVYARTDESINVFTSLS